MRARVLLVLGFAVSGCLQPVADGATLTLDEWCVTREDLFLCDGQAGCGVADPLADCADVHANVTGPVVGCDPAIVDAVDAGRVRFDGAAAAQCHARARTTCDTSRFTWDCAGVFSGTRALGQACHLQAECGAGLWCDASTGTCPGVCAARLADGTPATTSVSCASGWLAPLADGGTRCAAPPGPGDACLDGLCRPGLSCAEGTCVEPVPAGGACDAGPCTFGTICVAGACTAWARRGEPCASQFFPVDAGAPPCQLGLACRAGVCGDALRDGESCREEPNRCGGGTRCSLTTYRCARLGLAGAVCTSSADCDRLSCIDGACSRGQPEGAACDGAHPCVPGANCVNGACAARQCL